MRSFLTLIFAIRDNDQTSKQTSKETVKTRGSAIASRFTAKFWTKNCTQIGLYKKLISPLGNKLCSYANEFNFLCLQLLPPREYPLLIPAIQKLSLSNYHKQYLPFSLELISGKFYRLKLNFQGLTIVSSLNVSRITVSLKFEEDVLALHVTSFSFV